MACEVRMLIKLNDILQCLSIVLPLCAHMNCSWCALMRYCISSLILCNLFMLLITQNLFVMEGAKFTTKLQSRFIPFSVRRQLHKCHCTVITDNAAVKLNAIQHIKCYVALSHSLCCYLNWLSSHIALGICISITFTFQASVIVVPRNEKSYRVGGMSRGYLFSPISVI
jgi:hypothetical protein